MNLPSENPTYIKIDDSSFYLATTSSTQFVVQDVLNQIAFHQSKIDALVGHLQNASDQGVATASKALDTLSGQSLSAVLDKTTPLTDVLSKAS